MSNFTLETSLKNIYDEEIGPKQIATGLLGAALFGLALAAIAAPLLFVVRWIF